MSGSQIQTKRSQAALAGDYARRHIEKEGRPTDDTVHLWMEAVAPGMLRHDVAKRPDASDELLRRLVQNWTMSWAMARVVGDQLVMIVWDRGVLDTGTLSLSILHGVEGVAMEIDWAWGFRPHLVFDVFGPAAGRMMESARRRAYAATDEPGRKAWLHPMNAFQKKYQPKLEVMIQTLDGAVNRFRIVEMPVWAEAEQKPCLILQGGSVSVPLDRVVEPLDILVDICRACWIPAFGQRLLAIADRLNMYDGHLAFPGFAKDFYSTEAGQPTWVAEAGKIVATKRPEEWVIVMRTLGDHLLAARTREQGLVVIRAKEGEIMSLTNALSNPACQLTGKARANALKAFAEAGFKITEVEP